MLPFDLVRAEEDGINAQMAGMLLRTFDARVSKAGDTELSEMRADATTFIERGFGFPVGEHHREMAQAYQEHDRIVVHCPIEHGKTVWTTGYTLWYLGHHPDLCGSIGSATYQMARKPYNVIRRSITQLAAIRRVFPELEPAMDPVFQREVEWSNYAFRLSALPVLSQDPSLTCFGLNSEVLGSRWNFCWIDNPLTKRNTNTLLQRVSSRQKIELEVLSRLIDEPVPSKVILTDTAWYADDAMFHFGKLPGWAHLKFDADNNIWPVKWPVERREKKRAEIGELAYARTMKCQPRSSSTEYFVREDLVQNLRPGHFVKRYRVRESAPASERDLIVTGVDLGHRTKIDSDSTVICTCAFTTEDRRLLLNMERGNIAAPKIISALIRHQRRYQPDLIVVENIAAQDYIVQMLGNPAIMKACGARREEIRLMRVEGYATGGSKIDDVYGIPGLAAEFQQGQWDLPGDEQLVHQLIDEMVAWSPNDHTGDSLMALWLAVEGLRRLVAGEWHSEDIEDFEAEWDDIDAMESNLSFLPAGRDF